MADESVEHRGKPPGARNVKRADACEPVDEEPRDPADPCDDLDPDPQDPPRPKDTTMKW